jgi:hypothetical protein
MWHSLITIAVLLVLVIAAIPLVRRNMRKVEEHNDEMKSWAETHGYDYVYEDDSQYAGYSLYPFGEGTLQHAHRVITGTYAERSFAAYDYEFTTFGSGGGSGATSSSTIYFAMIVMALPNKVPNLLVTERKHQHHRDLKNAIDTGDEAFDRDWALYARDQDYAKSAMSPTLKAGLTAQALTDLRIFEGQLFIWHTRRQHDVALIDGRLRFAAAIAAELPAPS